jgi:hypothetical protein
MAMPIPFIEFHKQWFKMIEMVYKIWWDGVSSYAICYLLQLDVYAYTVQMDWHLNLHL